jgi:hypothetical protein
VSITMRHSWRAHMQAVTSVDFVSRRAMIVTASADATVALWTVSGKHVGVFGQSAPGMPMGTPPWDINDASTWPPFETLPQPSLSEMDDEAILRSLAGGGPKAGRVRVGRG